VRGTTASQVIFVGEFRLVELGGLEPPTPCLQSDVSIRVTGLDLYHRLAVSDRYVPLRTEANGTLMARRPNRPYVTVSGL
jgi:hypothetical protein